METLYKDDFLTQNRSLFDLNQVYELQDITVTHLTSH